MAKNRNRRNVRHTQPAPVQHTASRQAKADFFTFGDPEPVLEGMRGIWNYVACGDNGRWYEPPASFEGLARSFRANPHHETALRFKRDVLVRSFIPHPLLDEETFSGMALDYLIFGNAYLERRQSRTGRLLELNHPLAKFMRRASDLENFIYLQYGTGTPWLRSSIYEPHAFEPGSVFMLREPDINQEIYGLPGYLSALQSVWLNEEATLFRRKYYKNGSHAGFILYATDETLEDADIEALKQKLKESKGPGNFRNLFLYAPKGKKDGLQLIPVGEVAAKDEFSNIKNISRDDILVPHRVPPQLLGIVPQNSGGFGSIKDAAQVFLTLEIMPIQNRMKALNKWLGVEVVRFFTVKEILQWLVDSSQDGSRSA